MSAGIILRIVQCSTCKAPVFFAETEDGKAMPVDRDPVPNGNLEIEHPADPRDAPRVYVLDAQGGRYVEGPGGSRMRTSPFIRYRSHFATCPDAAKHRKAVKS